MSNDLVIVLGMHRSGTSCLTGLLQQAGLELGDVVTEAPYNTKGNRENLGIMELNNEVLSYNNGSWDSPPRQITWNPDLEDSRDMILNLYSNQTIWGFKDPRVIFTLPFWLKGLRGTKLHFIGTIRHPLKVAKSLNARQSSMSIEKGIDLWKRYNERLLEYRKKYNFHIVDFDLAPAEYLQSTQEAIHKLGVLPKSNNSLNFFDPQLRHQINLEPTDIEKYSSILEPVMPIYKKIKDNT